MDGWHWAGLWSLGEGTHRRWSPNLIHPAFFLKAKRGSLIQCKKDRSVWRAATQLRFEGWGIQRKELQKRTHRYQHKNSHGVLDHHQCGTHTGQDSNRPAENRRCEPGELSRDFRCHRSTGDQAQQPGETVATPWAFEGESRKARF